MGVLVEAVAGQHGVVHGQERGGHEGVGVHGVVHEGHGEAHRAGEGAVEGRLLGLVDVAVGVRIHVV